VSTADLFASNSEGSARVPLTPEDINKLRVMLDMALSQPLSADTQERFTTLGVIQSFERSGLLLSAAQLNGKRTARLLAVGVYGVPRLHFDLSPEETKGLDDLLLKGVTELNKELPSVTSGTTEIRRLQPAHE
jgi:hypothetical protein